MRKFLKYDIKSNKGCILTILGIHLFILLFLFLARVITPLTRILRDGLFTDIFLISSIIIFIIENVVFIGLILYEDYFRERSKLSFILPIKRRDIILSKLILLSLFYLMTSGFLLLSLSLDFFILSSDFIYYLLFGWALLIFISLITNLIMARTRFKGGFDPIFSLVLVLIFVSLAFILTGFKGLVLIDGSLSLESNLALSFIYPFAIEGDKLYKIISPLIVYIFLDLALFFINARYIDKNVNLA